MKNILLFIIAVSFSTGLFAQFGNVGINTTTPGYKLQVDGETGGFDDAGIRIENVTGNTGWSFYPSSSGVMFIGKTTNLGTFDGTSGAYTATSDARLKKDITPLEDVLSNVLSLEVKRYKYIHNNPQNREFIGVLAQDVQQNYPEFVSVNTTNDGNPLVQNQMGVDYAGLSVLAIKAIQEQQQIINAQNAVIQDLQERLEKLEQSSRK
ncbi:MAG: tail fiber domain-containing protein [Bacteroidetes bacterium]|nr:tail fiber domain-containing protein [Bacteroidota bacterium]